VPVDLTEAYAWLAVATENGAKPTGRDALAAQFTSTQLAEANVAVAKLRAHLARPRVSAPAALPVAQAPTPASMPTPGVPPLPAAVPVAAEPDAKALLAAAQADLAELLVEHRRVRGLLQTVSQEKSAMEKQLAELPSAPAASGDRTKLEKLADALDEARAENARLAGVVETAQRERATFDERLAAAAQLLQREREALQARVATAEAAAVKARSSASPAAATDPEFANLRAQIAQLTRDNETLRNEHQQARQQLADVTAQFAAARAPAAASLASVATEASPSTLAPAGTSAEANRIAKLLADNARLNDEVRRATILLSTLNRQLRGAHESLAKAGLAVPLIAANPQEQATLADLTREVAELRASQRALAEENRRLTGGQTVVAKPAEGVLGGSSLGDRQAGR
jgi:regulator of replication initiation timing